MTPSGNEVRLLGEVRPGGVSRLPLQAVHTPTAEIFFSVEGMSFIQGYDKNWPVGISGGVGVVGVSVICVVVVRRLCLVRRRRRCCRH